MMPLYLSIFCHILLATCALANPTPIITANYDDLPPPPASVVLEPGVGNYQGLYYNAWHAGGGGIAGSVPLPVQPGGLKTESSPRYIVTSAIEQATNGTPSIAVTPPYSSFSLLDFYFGCILRTTVGASEAKQCTIRVAGFVKKGGQEVAVATFTFSPTITLGGVPMEHAVLPDTFKGLVNVTIIETDPATTGLEVDNLRYTLSK